MTQEYFHPNTVQEAVSLLQATPGKARIIGGGTDLLLAEARPANKSPRLVDLGRIPGMLDIREQAGWLIIGGCVTHSQAAASPLVQKHAKCLAEGCAKVGSTQIRNMGTLAGNVVNGLPAADSAVNLTALGAYAVLAGPDGTQDLSMDDMYLGIGRSACNSRSQVLTHFRLPLAGPGFGSAYARMEQRKALALPMLCVAASLHLENGLIVRASIVVAPAGPGPIHAAQAEHSLIGQKPDKDLFAKAGQLACMDASFRGSAVRGSKEYREGVLPVFVRRALAVAAERAAL